VSLCRVGTTSASVITLLLFLLLTPVAWADDVDPPTLVSSDPADGAALAVAPSSLVVHFSEDLATSPAPSVALTGGPPVMATVEGSDVIVTPTSPFTPHSTCSLIVTGVTDLAGNAAAQVTIDFSVDRIPSDLRLTLERATTTYGSEVRLTARASLPGVPLLIERRLAGEAGFTALPAGSLDLLGRFVRFLKPPATATYRVTTPETADLAATSAEVTLSLRPRLRLTTPAAIWKGQRIVFRGRVAPAHPGATVTIQRKVDGAWREFRAVTLNDESRFTTRWKPPKTGTYRFRLTMAADELHLSKTTGGRATVVSPPNPHGISPLYKHFIVVDLSECHLYYYESGRVIRTFDCVVGKPSTPTPVGQWPVYQKVVGMWGPYGPFTMWYHYPYHFGIHGTNEPWLLKRFPRYYSHGCTRLANTNISWLFPKVPVGTPVRNIR
jgi:hypothetical protein